MSEEAKAVQELAKLGSKSLETAEKLGGWTGNVFGDALQIFGGAMADSAAGFRLRNRLSVLEKTHARLAKSKLLDQLRPLSDRMALPIYDAISDEPDEALQDVWAGFLEKSLDPSQPSPDRLLVGIIRNLEPADWPVLKTLFAAPGGALSSADLGLDDQSAEVVMDRLAALGLFAYDDQKSAYLVTDQHMKGVLGVKIGEASYYANKSLYRLRSSVSYE